MVDISLADLRQYYQGSVILYKGVPTYVARVVDHATIQVMDIRTGKVSVVRFNLEDFQNPAFRLGMVNIMGSVAWLSRIPVRRYSVGICQNNISIKYPQGVQKEFREIDVIENRLRSLSIPELADCIENNYPDFNSAYEQAIALQGTFAFDKQFAIHHNGDLIYKFQTVGFVDPESGLTEESFLPEYRYLHLLLDKRYEKGIGNHRL